MQLKSTEYTVNTEIVGTPATFWHKLLWLIKSYFSHLIIVNNLFSIIGFCLKCRTLVKIKSNSMCLQEFYFVIYFKSIMKPG